MRCALSVRLASSSSLIAQKWRNNRRPEDVKCCIMYLRYLCASGQRHEVPDLFSFPVAATLVHVLVAQVELELGDVDEDIEEMTDLCDDLLNSDISTNSLIGPIVTFVKTFHGRVKEPFETQVPSENGIGCLRTAIIRLPDLHEVSISRACQISLSSLLSDLFG